MFSTVCQREEVGGWGCVSLPPDVPPASLGAGGSDSDIREATLWFSEARIKRCIRDLSLGCLAVFL